jgi:hypothetical protein
MSDIADEIVETLVAAPTNDQRAYVRDAIARELAQVSEVLKDYITQAKARDNGLSTSDLKPIFTRYHRGEISGGLLIEEIRLAALATVDKLTAQATKERDDARAALIDMMDNAPINLTWIKWHQDKWQAWRKAAGLPCE